MSQSYIPSPKEIEDMLSGGDRHIKFKTVCKRGQEDTDEVIQGLAQRPTITVGIHSDVGMHDQEDPTDPPVSVAQVAYWNEFGTKRGIPERSFLRSAIDGNRAKHNAMLEKLILKIYAGEMTVDGALEVFALYLETAVKNKVMEITDPANDPATVKGKGSSKPLIDTKQMFNSIFGKVHRSENEGPK